MEVGGTIEEDSAADSDDAGGEHHVPGCPFAPDKGIAKIVRRAGLGRDLAQDGVARILLPGEQAVRARRQALGLHLVAYATRAGVENGGHAVVVHRAAGETAALIRPTRGRRQRDRQVGPVDEIVANRVPPVDVSQTAPSGLY